MDDYPSNSRKTREVKTEPVEESTPKVEKIIQGNVTRRKRSLGRRFKELFIGSEDARGIGVYLLNDVAVPALKDTVSDLVTQGVERALFGEVRGRSSRSRYVGSGGRVSYNQISTNRSIRTQEPRAQMSPQGRATHDFAEIILDTRAEGLDVLEALYDRLSQFQVVSLADLYGLVGVEPITFIDRKWGWEDLAGSQVIKVRGGYMLDLPRPLEID